MNQIEIDMEAETPDVPMLSTKSSSNSNNSRQPRTPQDLIELSQANDALQNSFYNLNEILESASIEETIEFLL